MARADARVTHALRVVILSLSRKMKTTVNRGVWASFFLASFVFATDSKPTMREPSHDAAIIAEFVAAINRRDVATLGNLMTEDHTFIDSSGKRVSGREEVVAGWKAYFAMFPDFAIRADTTLNDKGTFAIFGSVSGTYNGRRGLVAQNRITMSAAWKAIVADGKVKLWQVYCDWREGMHIIDEDQKSG